MDNTTDPDAGFKLTNLRLQLQLLLHRFLPIDAVYRESILFDAKWYLAKYEDVRTAGVDPLVHYLAYGWKERRDPGPFFSTSLYLDRYKNVRDAGIEPLRHFIEIGAFEGRWPNAAFDTEWYLARYPEVLKTGQNALVHYLERGAGEGNIPHPLFDPKWFTQRHGIAVEANSSKALAHFLSLGSSTDASPIEFFDCGYYRRQYEDVSKSGDHPITHYIVYGSREGRNPSVYFDTTWYLETNPDVASSGMNPLVHFLHYGRKEGRLPVRPVATFSVKESLVSQLKLRLRSFLQLRGRLRFPARKKLIPDVSVILILYNQAHFTLRCLESLRLLMLLDRDIDCEIIVHDNGSTDDTRAMLELCENITVNFSNENLGFLRGVNKATEIATGRNILLLNNDTEVTPLAIRAALQVMDEERNVGAVGGRLILPEGKIQEAGSILWADGSCLGYQRNAAPEDSTVMFRRDVDYCSGAFLMIDRYLFNTLGRFDESLAPAYYEETDFCIRLHESGFRVIYEPNALIFHFEFGSAPSVSHVNAQSERNRLVVREKHADYLRTRLEMSSSNVTRGRDSRANATRVLVIDDKVPHRWRGSGFPRSLELIRSIEATLRDNGIITLLTTDEDTRDWPAIRQTLSPRIEVAFGQTVEQFDEFIRNRQGFYDTVLVSRPHNAARLNKILDKNLAALGNARLIYDAEALFSHREILEREQRNVILSDDEKEALVSAEVALARHASTVLAVSPREAAEFKRRLDAEVFVLGHTLKVTATAKKFSSRRGMLFVGAVQTDSSPNGDSLLWFFRNVWPIILRLAPEPISMNIVGQNFSELVASECPEGIELLGRLEDLEPFYSSCRVFVAPTRFAAGVPHKVHEAAAHGVPCVVSSLIHEQLGWTAGREVSVGNDAESFARACISLHENETLWKRIRQGGLSAVQRDCDPASFLMTVEKMLQTDRSTQAQKPANFRDH